MNRSRFLPITALRVTLLMILRRQLRSFIIATTAIALGLLATLQPTASALDFPMATHIVLPDSVDLTVKPVSMLAMYSQLQTNVSVSASALAMVSLASRQIELARTKTGAQGVAREIMNNQYRWSDSQFGCLRTLWDHESHWNYKAHNYNSGAHGIAQAMPADKMDVIATDWRTNPVTQIRWGLRYIKVRYSTPCQALGYFNSRGSY